MLNFESNVRRSDLELRTEYIGLETAIYELPDESYEIICLSNFYDFDEMSNRFDEEIKTLGVPVRLSLEKPFRFKRRIGNIAFDNPVAEFEGFGLNMHQIRLLVLGKYANLDIEEVSNDNDNRIIVEIGYRNEKPIEQGEEIKSFLSKVSLIPRVSIHYVPFNYRKVILDTSLGLVTIGTITVDEGQDNTLQIKAVNTSSEELHHFRKELLSLWPGWNFVFERDSLDQGSSNWSGIINTYLFNEQETTVNVSAGRAIIKSKSPLTKQDQEKVEKLIRKALEGTVHTIDFIIDPSILSVDNIAVQVRTYRSLPYSSRDAALWYENIDNIYNLEFSKSDLYFYDENSTKCYVDASLFKNTNLRNQLMLYDTIYLTPPLEADTHSNLDKWLKDQGISQEALLELIAKNSVKILLSNDETRYNTDFLNHVYQTNPNAITTRRGLSVLLASEFADLASRSIIKDLNEQDWKALITSIEIIARRQGPAAKRLLTYLTWPLKAKNQSFAALNFGSPLSIPSFGAHQALIPSSSRKVEFEFVSNSLATYIASALSATYFPFMEKGEKGLYSDRHVSNIVNGLLLSYKYPHRSQIKELQSMQRALKDEQSIIHLFDTRSHLDIIELDNVATKYDTREHFKELLIMLDKLPLEERKKRIEQYERILSRLHQQSSRKEVDSLEYVLSAGGFVPTFGTIASIISILRTIWRDVSGLDDRRKIGKLIDKFSERQLSDVEAEGVYCLDKLDRNAILK